MSARFSTQEMYERTAPSVEAPRYAVMARHLMLQIASGTLPEGAPVPSIRVLAHCRGVTLTTAGRAAQILERLGLVQRHRGLPYVVTAGAREAARKMLMQDLRMSWPTVRASLAAIGASELVEVGDRTLGAPGSRSR